MLIINAFYYYFIHINAFSNAGHHCLLLQVTNKYWKTNPKYHAHGFQLLLGTFAVVW